MIPYFDVGKQIFGSFQDMLDARVDKKRQPAALVRLKRYAGTERGYEPITKLARARIEERMNDSSLTWPWVVEVQQDLDNAPRYIDGMRDLLQKSGLKGWQKDFDALTRELKAHNDWVRSTVLPRARKTNRLPPEIYADNLKAYGVEADPRDLMQRAMFAYLQTRDEMDSLARIYAAQKGLKSSNYRDVIRELKKNRVAGDQVLPVYKSHLAQLEDILRAAEHRHAAEACGRHPPLDGGGGRRLARSAHRPAATHRQYRRARGIRVAAQERARRRDGRLRFRRHRLDHHRA